MAKDGMNIRLEGGANLDRILSKMQQRVGTRIVEQSLNKGAADVRKKVKAAIPRAKKDTTGFITSSRNTTKGTLRRSVKSGLRKKVNLGRQTFMAGVWLQDTGKGDKSDGWFAKFVYGKPHADNAFGFSGGRNLNKAIKSSKGGFRKTVGSQLAQKIAKHNQKIIDSKLK